MLYWNQKNQNSTSRGSLQFKHTTQDRDVAERQENKGRRLQASGKRAGTRGTLPLPAPRWGTGWQHSPSLSRAPGHIQASLQQPWLLLPRPPCSCSLGQMIAHWPCYPMNGRRRHCTAPRRDPPLQCLCQNQWSVQSLLSPRHLNRLESKSQWTGSTISDFQPPYPKPLINLNLTNREQENKITALLHRQE